MINVKQENKKKTTDIKNIHTQVLLFHLLKDYSTYKRRTKNAHFQSYIPVSLIG